MKPQGSGREHRFVVLDRTLDGTANLGRDVSQAIEPTEALDVARRTGQVSASRTDVLLKDRQLRATPYRIVFVSEPICWTEVPSTLSVFARQRRRWSQGLAEILWQHRRMIANPRYGRVGLVVLPYFLAFELLGPVVEVVGVMTVLLGLAFGLVDPASAWLFAAVALGYGLLLSVASITVEVFSFRRYVRWRDLGSLMVAAAVIENLGFRQLHAWWRLQGIWRALRRTRTDWGAMPRAGFAADEQGQARSVAVAVGGGPGVNRAPIEAG